MTKLMKLFAAGTALLAYGALPATGADIYEPPVVDYQPPEVIYEDDSFGGWYIRGDIDFHKSDISGVSYTTYGGGVPGSSSFDTAKLKGAFSLGAGVGYQINRYLRTDVTADYWFKSDFEGSTSGTCAGGVPCTSIDTSAYSALLLLANAYAEFGTWHRITPYVGAGIGGAYVKWDDLNNVTSDGQDDWHSGAKGWRFAWAVMAGASYCVTNNLHADVGYRFSRIEGGRMFDYLGTPANVGPGYHKAINTHEVRAGLRYQFGGNDRCGEEQIVYNEPEPYIPPVYK